MDSAEVLANEVRWSLTRTRAERTALLRYCCMATPLLHLIPGFVGAGPLGGLELADRPVGRIEFGRDRSLHSQGDFWQLFVDGVSYIGEPGEWELDGDLTAFIISEPHWLLAVADSCIQAWDRGVLRSDDESLRWLELRCDLNRAVGPSGRHASAVALADDIDPENVTVEIALDGSKLVRAASFIQGMHASVTKIELSGFGEPEPIEAPANPELLPPEE